jgi:hypothetical protein
MKWVKRGLVYAPRGDEIWARSHAYLPTVEVLGDDRLRVYFASLDEHKVGRIGFVDLSSEDPCRVIQVSQRPVFDIGSPGTFDDQGVSPSCILNVDGQKRLYYFGWQSAGKVPYLLFTGVAFYSEEEGVFHRYRRVPVMDRTNDEPFVRSAGFVLPEGSGYRMWYVSATGWWNQEGKTLPRYTIRCTTSKDGLRWDGESRVCLSMREDEFRLGRPWVLKGRDCYRMWYSVRSTSKPYRIRYAESEDGWNWVRKDEEGGIDVSESGWDSEMVCFPCVVEVAGRTYMFYNGNGHGSTGFGVAELKS